MKKFLYFLLPFLSLPCFFTLSFSKMMTDGEYEKLKLSTSNPCVIREDGTYSCFGRRYYTAEEMATRNPSKANDKFHLQLSVITYTELVTDMSAAAPFLDEYFSSSSNQTIIS
ncbi:MAG: hypothetical protein LBD98_01075 [Endomicrobium sp.]|jgi:hypothetical protein|nr:hypothetical protein [Endomicrobium sp.]